MNGIQKRFTGLGGRSPERRAALEAESRTWMIRCPYCGYERSVWEAGGVRYKAAGNSRQLRRCPQCGKLSWHMIYRQTGPPGPGAAPPTLAPSGRRPLLWALGLGGIVAIVAAFAGTLIFVIGALTQPVVSAGDAFMTALQTGQYAQAYALCTPALQQQLGGAPGLATLVRAHQPARWTWTSRSIRNGVGRLDGALTYAGGKPGRVHLVLQPAGSAWQIAGFQMNPT